MAWSHYSIVLLNLRNHIYQCKRYDLIYGYKGSDPDHVPVISIYVWKRHSICDVPYKLVFGINCAFWKRTHQEPNGIYDTGATSGVGAIGDAKYFISTGNSSNKRFVIPNSDTMSATKRMILAQKLRAPENEVDLVPRVHSTLLNGVKFADADYVTILNKEGINIYDEKKTKIIISEKAVLSGYCKEEGFWRIPLKKIIHNINMDTLMIQHPFLIQSIFHVF